MLELEITSLKCEKDFLLTSLDEIDALIFKRQEEAEMKTSDQSSKRSVRSMDAPPPKKHISVQDRQDSVERKEFAMKEEDVGRYCYSIINRPPV